MKRPIPVRCETLFRDQTHERTLIFLHCLKITCYAIIGTAHYVPSYRKNANVDVSLSRAIKLFFRKGSNVMSHRIDHTISNRDTCPSVV
jgi:hypothetical protein